MTECLRIGIVGAGGIVRSRHMPALTKIENVKVVAVCNQRREMAEAFAKEWAVEAAVYDRWEEVVDHDGVDVVWVGAPPYLHASVTEFALQCGKHVFCQARMAASLEEAGRMWEASIRFHDRVTALCPPPQGMRGRVWVKRMLQEGAFGKLLHLDLKSYHGGWLANRDALHWRRNAEVSGIQVLTLGIYAEVLMDWLGPIGEVQAQAGLLEDVVGGEGVEIPDFVQVLAKFRAGLMGVLTISGVAAHAGEDQLWLHGSEGVMRYEFGSERIWFGRADGAMEEVAVPPGEVVEWTVEADFIRAVRDPLAPRPRPDFTEGLRYMRVVDAVWQSLARRAAVQIG